MRSAKRGTVLAWIALSGALLPAPAQSNEINHFELSPEQLFDATVISVSKSSQKLMDAPAAVYVLTNEDIMRSGATSIPEVLRLVPGVQVARANANSWAISVRGFNGSLANKLLVLMDGREVYDPLFAGVYWDIQDTVLADIERIEVIRGPGASLWGANAVNGVINIITKKAEDTQGNLASVTVGNQDKAIVDERYGGKIGDNGYYRVYGKYLNREDEQTVTGGNARDQQITRRAGFRSDWKEDSHNDYTVQGDIYQNNDGDFRNLPNQVAPFARPTQENIESHGGNIQGRWNRSFADDSRMTLQSYVNYTARSQILLKDDRMTYDLNGQYQLPVVNAHEFIVGGGYRYSVDDLTDTTYIRFSESRRADQLFNTFVQDKITLEPKTWFLTLGSKLEHNDYTGFEIQPNARLQWHPDEKQMVWTSVGRAVRTPSRLEHDLTINAGVLSLGGVPAQLALRANPNFGSEELIAYEAGYRNQLTPSLLLDVSTFYNDYSKLSTISFLPPSLILTPPAHFLFPLLTTNDTKAESYGFEALTNWRVNDVWNLSASYSLLIMQLHGPDINTAINSEMAESQSPNHQVNLRSQWDISKNVSFDSTLYYVSGLQAYSVEDHIRLDMRLGWRVTDGIQVSLVGQDLLNDSHREFSDPTDIAATEINRSIYGNVTWRF